MPAKKTTPPVAAHPQAEVDWSTEPPPVHANFASISSSPEDFAIVFCSVPPSGKATPEGRFLGRIVSSVRMSPATFYKVIVAMVGVWNRFAEQSLPPDAPRFREHSATSEKTTPQDGKK